MNWRIITLALCLLLAFSNIANGQRITGKVRDNTTGASLSYVNIGIVGGNVGTVSNENGLFSIEIESSAEADTLRASLLGYSSVELSVKEIRGRSQDDTLVILLESVPIVLKEIEFLAEENKPVVLGTPAKSKMVNAGFFHNNLGHEIGSLFNHLGSAPAVLDSVQLNIAKCNYEQIFLRLNVYDIIDGEYTPRLQKPIYVSISCAEALKNPYVNLEEYSVFVKNQFVVSVELVKDLGEKGLYFFANLNDPVNPGVYRATSQANWNFIKHKSKPVGISIRAFLH